MTIDEQINEVLSKDATAGDWIHDFVHSDNPKFADKSKDKRKEMALAAYYAKQRNEAVVNFPKTKDDHPREITGHDAEHAWAMKYVSKNKDDKISYQHNGVTIHHPDGKHTFVLGGHKPIFDKDSKGKLSFKKDLSVASRAYVMPTKSANKNNVVSLKKEEVELEEAKDEREYGYEGDMALNQLKTLTRCAEMITDMLKPDTDLPEWVQSKITLATDYIQTAADYMYSEMNEEVKDEYARKVDKHLKNKYAPVAPVPDRKYIKGTPENLALKASRKPINGHPTNVKEGTMKSFREVIQSIQEANHREFAQQGKMHHDMAKHMNPGHEMDFYHSTTGDKISGVVKHNSGKEVHIKANKDGKLGAGDMHKFTVTNKLDEALVGGQKALDKNKNGKVDAHDFKMLRGEQCPECGMPESKCDCDHMSEQSPVAPTLDKKYIKGTPENKAHKEKNKPINGHPTNSMKEAINDNLHPAGAALLKHIKPEHHNKYKAHLTTDTFNGSYKDRTDVLNAAKKAGHLKEETELDELSKSTLGSYAKKASRDAVITRKIGADFERKADAARSPGMQAANTELSSKYKQKSFKRRDGLEKAVDRLSKEEVETRTVSFSDFITQLNEYTPGKDGVTRIQGKSYGAQYRDPEGEDDAFDRKPKQVAKPEPEVKRGRGRPAGSKSGANQKVTSGTKRSGVDYSGYKLHLPNSNR